MDGRPPAELGIDALRESFRREGFECRLGLRRGDERREVLLKTGRLI